MLNSPPLIICLILKFFFFFFWLNWMSVVLCGLSLVAVSGGHSTATEARIPRATGPRCLGFSSCSTGSVVMARGPQGTGSVVVTYRLSCSSACGIFLDQGLNPCTQHWQVDSYPLCHLGSPEVYFKECFSHCGKGEESQLTKTYCTRSSLNLHTPFRKANVHILPQMILHKPFLVLVTASFGLIFLS